MSAKRITVHAFEIEDKPGGLHRLLAKAAEDGVDLNCLSASGSVGAKAMAYLSAKNPEALKACAIKVGAKTTEMAGIMLSGEDRAGAAAEALKPLAEAGVNGVAAAAMVLDGGYGMMVIVALADGDRAAEALGA